MLVADAEALNGIKTRFTKLLNNASQAWVEDKPIDPYLVWTVFGWLRAAVAKELDLDALLVSVLVEFDEAAIATARDDPVLRMPGVLPSHLHSAQRPWLRVRPCIVTFDGLSELLTFKHAVKRFELCTQRDVLEAAQDQAAPSTSTTTRSSLQQSKAQSDAARKAHARYALHLERQQTEDNRLQAPSKLAPLVCVIDDLCNFASPRLVREHVAGVVTSLWHQGSDKATTQRLDDTRRWSPALDVPELGSSPFLRFSGALLGRRLDPRAWAGSADEARTYREVRYFHPPMRFSHGSTVLDLVAGLATQPGGTALPDCASPNEVCFVQLPVPSVVDTTGGSLASHALDGLHHALEAAAPGQCVIANLSYGTHAGPHDGTSIWDVGLKELLDRFAGKEPRDKLLHVVLPAGNSHRSRCHAHLHVSASHTKQVLRWQVMPDDPSANFLELWFPRGVRPLITVTSPSAQALTAENDFLFFNDGSMLLFPDACAQSAHGSMALLCIGPSATYRPAVDIQFKDLRAWIDDRTTTASFEAVAGDTKKPPPRSAHGVWKIEVGQGKHSASQDFMFHAWVMRGDAAPQRRQARHGNAGRQSYLLDPDGETVDPRATLNGIACLEHERLWVVGAMRRDDSSLAAYSAAGPNRDSGAPSTGKQKQHSWRIFGPDVVVPADESLNRSGLLTAGTLSGSRVRVSGTSIAAAAFTRILYSHLAAGNPACTITVDSPSTPSRVSPTGNPYVHDAELVLRGECNRLEAQPAASAAGQAVTSAREASSLAETRAEAPPR